MVILSLSDRNFLQINKCLRHQYQSSLSIVDVFWSLTSAELTREGATKTSHKGGNLWDGAAELQVD